MRQLALALAAALFALPVAFEAAQAQTCAALQSELRSLQRAGGGSNRYERAYREQANVLVRTDRRARRAGCFGGGLFQRRSPECRALVPKLNEMQRNLTRLDRQRRKGGGGGGGNPRRARQIQRALAAGDCTPTRRTDRQARREQEERLEQAARERRRESREERRESRQAVLRGAPQSRPRGGTFRTLCVRTCDGYYFPISFSTTRDRFGDDAQACTNMCGGTETELFAHPNPGGGPEDMVSVQGQPYSELPTAFAYRTNLTPSCSCKPSGGDYSVLATSTADRPGSQSKAELALPLLPRARPEPGEDPETLANRLGGFTPEALSEPPQVMAGATSPDGRPVRTVGPTYWAAPEQEGVVLTPVPN